MGHARSSWDANVKPDVQGNRRTIGPFRLRPSKFRDFRDGVDTDRYRPNAEVATRSARPRNLKRVLLAAQNDVTRRPA